MDETKESITALLSAYARAWHATHAVPKVFDDHRADLLFTDGERDFFMKSMAECIAFFDPEFAATHPDGAAALERVMIRHNGPIPVSRGRYMEDSLRSAVAQGARQYVILGAGMDTFAFRQRELMERLDVFEVDHPATQASKRERCARLGWEIPARLHFVPMDFITGDLSETLRTFSYDMRRISFFSLAGVSYYLDRETVHGVFRSIAGAASEGSRIAFDYVDEAAFDPAKASARMAKMMEIVRMAGEPMKTALCPSSLGAELMECGLRLESDVSPEEIEARYFAGRTDGFHAFEHVHFAVAVVGDAGRN